MSQTIQVVSQRVSAFDAPYSRIADPAQVQQVLAYIGMPTEAAPAFLFILRDDAGSELLEVWGAANDAPGARAHRLA